MSSSMKIDAVAPPPGMGIMAPGPRVLMANDVKPGMKLEIRPYEPVHLFIPIRPGVNHQLDGLNKHSPFTVERENPPSGVAAPRTLGYWVKISVKPNTKAGKSDRVFLARGSIMPGAERTRTFFTLVAGNVRYY